MSSGPHGPIFFLSNIPFALYWNISFSGGYRISRRGGVDLVEGAVDPRGGYVSKILHVKTKESGPVGGARPLDPPMSLLMYYYNDGQQRNKYDMCMCQTGDFVPKLLSLLESKAP